MGLKILMFKVVMDLFAKPLVLRLMQNEVTEFSLINRDYFCEITSGWLVPLKILEK